MSPIRKPKASSRAKGTRSLKLGPVPLMVLSFLLAWAGHWQMSMSEVRWTFATGLALFLVAVGVLAFAVKAEKGLPTETPLAPRAEAVAAVLIFLAAALIRFWDLGTSPPGLFADQGYQGFAALEILHGGARPFFDQGLLKAPALFLYELAAWFMTFGAGELSERVFFVLVSLAAFPFLYWTFRELAGPRTALLALFILAVLRWHVNLSRWGFFGIHNYVFMFACLALFLYGRRTGRAWAFWVAGTVAGVGAYYYSAYYVFLLLLIVYVGYEWATDRRGTGKQRWALLGSAGLLAMIATPLAVYSAMRSGSGARMGEVSILGDVAKSGSLAPLWENLVKLVLMFDRRGDFNQRHDFHAAPMLDGLTGAFFVLGLFLALRGWKRRENFYLLSGLAVLSLPGLLSIEMPHAARLMGMVPFVALAAALPLAALWKARPKVKGAKKSLPAVLLVVLPLSLLAYQNLHAYFTLQMRDEDGWYWWDPVPTEIGRRLLADGGTSEFYVTPRCEDNYSVRFIGYPFRAGYKRIFPTDFLPLFPTAPGKGLEYVLEPQREGARALVKAFYPECREEVQKDPDGADACYFYSVPAEVVDRDRGLNGTFQPSGKTVRLPDFPRDLPPGPFQAELAGCVYLPESGRYGLDIKGSGRVKVTIGGKTVDPDTGFQASTGYYSIRVSVSVPAKASVPVIILQLPNGSRKPIDSGCLTTLPVNRGLLATYDLSQFTGKPTRFDLWEQTLDYDYGYKYPFISQGAKEPARPMAWSGELVAAREGVYGLRPWTTGASTLVLDGMKFECPPKGPGVSIKLKKGPHRFVIQSPSMPDNFILAWRPPGEPGFKVVPLEAFGETRLP